MNGFLTSEEAFHPRLISLPDGGALLARHGVCGRVGSPCLCFSPLEFVEQGVAQGSEAAGWAFAERAEQRDPVLHRERDYRAFSADFELKLPSERFFVVKQRGKLADESRTYRHPSEQHVRLSPRVATSKPEAAGDAGSGMSARLATGCERCVQVAKLRTRPANAEHGVALHAREVQLGKAKINCPTDALSDLAIAGSV